MNKLTRAILVGICMALFVVFVMLVVYESQSSRLGFLLFGAGFLTVVLDPGVQTFYLQGNAFATIAVNAIGWFLVGATIGYFFEKIKYIIGAGFVAYVIASILTFIILILQIT